jgi:ABC-2 type transport system permease protein/lipopolysaccharide transport system permease protein
MSWTFFSQSLGTGATTLLVNHDLMSKTQFPRECFPLEAIVVTTVNTVISWIPLAIIFIAYGFTPHVQSYWLLILMPLELLFTVGITLAFSALIIQMRDLAQVLPIILQLGLFATPVIWQFKEIPRKWQLLYGFINPLGPIIDDARRAMLLGLNPVPGPLLAAIVGSAVYLFAGYRIFKRLEVNFADIA